MRINNHLTSIVTVKNGEKNPRPKTAFTHIDNKEFNSVGTIQSPNISIVSSLQKTKIPDLENSQALAEQIKNTILAHPGLSVKTQANLVGSRVYHLLK